MSSDYADATVLPGDATPEHLTLWAAAAAPGAALCYHTGDLASDRRLSPALGTLALAALRLQGEERVWLLQRRVAEQRWRYLMVAR